MKYITLLSTLLFINFYGFAQDTEPPTMPVNFQFFEYMSVSGPHYIALEWEHATDNVGVTEYEIYLHGVLLQTIPYNGSNTIQYASYGNLANSTYCYTMLAKDAAGNSSPLTDEICHTINSIYPPNPNDIYISGYLNFDGNNKALEITNVNNSIIDLSQYTLKISHDGSPTWTDTYTFPANSTLTAYKTYVIANSNITMCADKIDSYDDIITSFDGNDVIGLFKNGVLIDVIGELGSNATIANNNTFMKVITMPYSGLPNASSNDPFRWTEIANGNMNNCPVYLGFAYLLILNTEEFETNTFQMYPNPATGNTIQFNTKNNQTIDSATIIDVNGRNIFTSTKIMNNQLDIQNIKQGVYFVKIQSGNKVSTHKLIRQ